MRFSQPISTSTIGTILGILGYFLFAVHDVVVKHLTHHHDPITLVFSIQLCAAIFIAILLISKKDFQKIPRLHCARRAWAWVIVRTLCSGIGGIAGFHALANLSLSAFYTVVFCIPIVALLMGIIFNKEYPTVGQIACVALALTGVTIAIPLDIDGWSNGYYWAGLMVLASATGSLCVRNIGTQMPALFLSLTSGMGAIAVASFLLLWQDKPFLLADTTSLMLCFAVGACVALGGWAITKGLQTAPLIQVLPMQYTQWIWGALAGWMLWNNTPTLTETVGAVLIVMAGIFLLRQNTQPKSTGTETS